MKFSKRLTANILASTIMGILYAYFDYGIEYSSNYQFMSHVFPFVMLYSMFIIPNVIIHYRHVWIGIANGTLALSIEDIAYWFWAWKLPWQWSPLYIVVWHIPIDDIAGIALVGIIYYLENKYVFPKI